jgi:hypothetical protein
MSGESGNVALDHWHRERRDYNLLGTRIAVQFPEPRCTGHPVWIIIELEDNSGVNKFCFHLDTMCKE